MIDTAKDILLSDPLSRQTRKERLSLLIVSLLSIAMTKAGLVPQKISALGIELQLANQKALLYIALLLVIYFIFAFTIYAASDFIVWRKAVTEYYAENVRSFYKRMKEPRQKDPLETILKDLEDRMRFWRDKAWFTSIIRAAFEFLLPLVVGVYAGWALVGTVNALPATKANSAQSKYQEQTNNFDSSSTKEAYRSENQKYPQIIQASDYSTIEAIEELYVEVRGLGKDPMSCTLKNDAIILYSIKDPKKEVRIQIDKRATIIGNHSYPSQNVLALFTKLKNILFDLSTQTNCLGIKIAQFSTHAYRNRTILDFDFGQKIVELDSLSNGPNNEERLYTLNIVNRKGSFFFSN